jgi:plasmid stabilization system protein ParE
MSPSIPIFFADSAVSDLQEILAYYAAEQVPHTGRLVVAGIIADIELLKNHPDMGRMVPEFESDKLRELIRPPFRIVYRREKSRVRIIRVWRSERLLKLP